MRSKSDGVLRTIGVWVTLYTLRSGTPCSESESGRGSGRPPCLVSLYWTTGPRREGRGMFSLFFQSDVFVKHTCLL